MCIFSFNAYIQTKNELLVRIMKVGSNQWGVSKNFSALLYQLIKIGSYDLHLIFEIYAVWALPTVARFW